MKYYTADSNKQAVKQVDFSNQGNFGDVNETYSSFFQKLMTFIYKIALYKTKQVKENNQ